MLRKAMVAVVAILLVAVPTQASAAIKIHRIYFDSPGSDTGSNASLNAEYIVIRNTGAARIGIGGWTIRDLAGHVYRFPIGFRVPAGAKVWVHTGSGSSGARHRYWGMGWYVWNNDGDTARLRRANGSVADTCSYSGAGSYIFC